MIEPYDLMRQYGVSLREKAITDRLAGRLSTTPMGGRMVREGSAIVLKAVQAWMDLGKTAQRGPKKTNASRTRKLVEDVGVERATAITLQVLIDKTTTAVESDCTVASLRRALGVVLETEAEWRRFKEVSPVGYSYTIKDYQRATGVSKAYKHRAMRERAIRDGGALDWDSQDRVMVAARLIGFAQKHAGLFTTRKQKHRNNLRTIIVLHPAVHDWVAKGEDLLGILPRYMPISSKPLPWGAASQGGFDAEKVPPVPFMSGRSKTQKAALADSDCPAVYSAVNALQDTKWRVNKATSALLRHSVENGWDECGIPSDPGDPPNRPTTEYDGAAPEWVEHMRRKRAWGVARADFRAATGGVGRSLSMASDFGPLPHFHMVHTVDFRGRCYPVGGNLGYQGADFQRALTEFAEGVPVGEGLEWFLINGANLFGQDKCTLEDRVAWVRSNSEELIACGQDPTRNRLWLEADKPFQFAAWASEYAKMQHEGDRFVSHLPIGMDGSNNGLQVYSLLLRDAVGGAATNCTPTSRPSDIYQVVADRATELIRHGIQHASDVKQRRWCRQILEFCKSQGLDGLPRKAAKRPTMVLPYGGTLYSTQGYLSEWYTDFVRGKNIPDELHPFPQRDAFQALNYLGTIMWQALGDVVVKAREAMDWLHTVSDLVSRHNRHVGWTTPLGLRCQQSYLKGRSKRIQLVSGGRIAIDVWEATDQVDRRKSRNGLAPNYIHSLDAAAMMHTTNLLKTQGVNDLRMIHDDYGVHAGHAVTLFKTLRYAFVDIFRHDLLTALRNELQKQLPEEDIPLPPTEGDLEIDKLLTANYFFA